MKGPSVLGMDGSPTQFVPELGSQVQCTFVTDTGVREGALSWSIEPKKSQRSYPSTGLLSHTDSWASMQRWVAIERTIFLLSQNAGFQWSEMKLPPSLPPPSHDGIMLCSLASHLWGEQCKIPPSHLFTLLCFCFVACEGEKHDSSPCTLV